MKDHAKNKYVLAENRRESQYLLQQVDTAASATTLARFSQVHLVGTVPLWVSQTDWRR